MTSSIELKLIPSTAGRLPIIPAYATAGANAFDVEANIDAPIELTPGTPGILIPTGIAINLDNRTHAALLLPRSGLGHKKGIELANTVGLIDSDYQGEIFASVRVKPGYPAYTIQPGERLAQVVIVPSIIVLISVVDEFSVVTNRGADGFGSTGS